MKNTMMICLALFAAFGCTGQSKAGKGKTQELTTMENQKEIYLAGGCFWGTEHFMKQIRGVEATQVGYQTVPLPIRITGRYVADGPGLPRL